MSAESFQRVRPTPEELAEWRTKNPGRVGPGSYRVQCIACGLRLWASGLGIGAHRRACPGQPA